MRTGERVLAVAGPVLFTATWFSLGAGHAGYSQTGGTISILAAYGAPGAAVMMAAFGVQAAAMLATARLLVGSGSPIAGVLLAVNGVGTVLVALLRTTCGQPDAQWCRVTDHPVSAALHVVVASISLVALAAAPWAHARFGRDRAVSLAVAVVGTPLLLAFGVGVGAGWAEKAFVTLAIGWAAWAGRRAPAAHPPSRRLPPTSAPPR